MKISKSIKLTGLILYTLTIMGGLIVYIDNIPPAIGSMIDKCKYLYLAFTIGYIILTGLSFHKKVSGILVGLILFQVIWGFVFTNPVLSDNIHSQAKEMILYFLFILGTVHFIRKNQMLKSFLEATIFVYLLLTMWCFLTHFSGTALLRYVFLLPGVITGSVDYGFPYGMGSYNLTGSVVSTELWLIVLTVAYSKDRNKELKVLGLTGKFLFLSIGISIIVLFLMLVTTTSRGEILSFILGTIYFVAFLIPMTGWKKRVRMILAVAIMVLGCIYLANGIVGDASLGRDENWSVNWEAFQRMGRQLIGMGYVNPWTFLEKGFPGYDTFPCDVYWLFVFFTTGYLGATIMAVILITVFTSVLFHKTGMKHYDLVMKCIVPMLIFNNFFHSTIFSYNYPTSRIMFAFIFEFLLENNRKRRSAHVR